MTSHENSLYIVRLNFGFENYLHILSDFNQRKSFTKFRISNHKLKIETGRYSKPITPLENRICEKCFSDEIESEEHLQIVYTRVRDMTSVKIWDTSYPKQWLFNRKSHMHIKISLLRIWRTPSIKMFFLLYFQSQASWNN
jgi:hypothetical protein